ncbi:PDxFFG protein [Mesomycoplasma bovoculi]|uniref:PDxFFG protein n=1 Tax=Mesomycoplasma bovoculi M165/69 TaxID=743966 RepID=W5UT08_9BACT|nr:PDxFFG protein [Mesomycoplasma bovoculi]AHH45349.1 hypothetical protein MYB_01700 [Mesomycoplasma bovoculi M165/69]
MKLSKPLSRFLIASATVAASTGILIAGIKLYSIHNELGVYPIQIKDKVSDFIAKKDQISEAEFVNTKGEKVAHFDVKALTDKSVKEPIVLEDNIESKQRRFSTDEFEKWFGEHYNRQTPIFNVRVGLMNFVNEYWDALEPQEFLEYALWFVNNVSWGPDAISLQHFALKKGVTRKGNNLLLGQHSGLRKEETKIDFYPDSFFGSFPIFSKLAGKGNALDNLTYKIFSNPISKSALDEYLATIPQKQVLANWDKRDNVAGLAGISLLKGQKVYKYNLLQLLAQTVGMSSPTDTKTSSAKKIAKEFDKFSRYNFIVFDYPGQTLDQVKEKFEAAALLVANKLSLQLPSGYQFQFDDLELQPKTIANVEIQRGIDKYTTNTGNDNFPQGILKISFEKSGDQTTNDTMGLYLIHNFKDSTMTLEIAEMAAAIKSKVDEIVKDGFYDLYNIHQGDEKQIGLYQQSPDEVSFFAIDNEWNPSPTTYAQNEYLSNFDSSLWSVWTVKNLEKVSPTILKVNLQKGDETTSVQSKSITFDLDPKKPDYKKQLREFSYFKQAINWFDRSTPRIIQEVDQLVNGKSETYYQLYADVYDGLIDTVLTNKPLTGEQLQGTYLTKTVDPKTGMLSYSSQKGQYIGFSPTSRISYISLLKASSPFFKTTGINYLKYVGTHEYGHHQTLTYAQDNSDPSTNVILNALSTITQPQVQSFYNLRTLQLYLDARSSGLKIRRSDPDLNSSLTGVFPNFSYKKGGENSFETEKEIYGSTQNQDIGVLLADPTRRFLQSFNGLKKAAQLRNLKLYDLFLLNSFDTESGTINPSTEDKAEYFRQSQKLLNSIVPGSVPNASQTNIQNQTKTSLSPFISGSDIKDLYTHSITDGKGNQIQFDENNKPIIATYTVNSDGVTFSNLDVKVFYPNGKPVIDVKTFKQSNSLAELTQAISAVQESFLRQLVVKFSDNGWNGTSNTNTSNVEKFRVNSQEWSNILTSLLTNPVEKYAFLNSVSTNNKNNVTFELADHLVQDLDIEKILSNKNEKTDPKNTKEENIKELFQQLQLNEQERQKIESIIQKNTKLKDKNKIIEFFKKKHDDVINQLNTQLKQIQNQQQIVNTTSVQSNNLYDELKNIGDIKNSFYQKISDAIFEKLSKYVSAFDKEINLLELSKVLLDQDKHTPTQTRSTKNGQEITANKEIIKIVTISNKLINLFKQKLYQEVANKLDTLLTFKVNGQTQKAPNLLQQLKKDILAAGDAGKTSDEYHNELFRFRNSIEFGSIPYAKIIDVNGKTYYQNPKYDIFVNINKLDEQGRIIRSQGTATISDNSETDPNSYDKPVHKAPLATLLKLDKLDTLGGLFGIARDFTFHKRSNSSELDKSKIYLDAWDSELFGFDYNHNYFVNQAGTTSFSKMSSFLDFISIDPFMMTIEKVDDDYVRNWNLDYTMTKFDLFSYAFDKLSQENKTTTSKPSESIQNSTTLIDKLASIFNLDKSEIQTKVQGFANTLMNAFEQSTLNLLFKNPDINNKNIDPLFLSSVGFRGFTTYKGNPSDDSSSLTTKFGPFHDLEQVKSGYKTTAFRYRAISDVNSVSFASESFVGDDLNNSNKSQVFSWIKDFLNENSIKYNDISLYMLQYIVGSKNYFAPGTNQPILYTQSDIELTNLRTKNQNRSEARPDDYFSNYVYNFPESLTRDFVQIHYVPSQQNLDNLPSAFSNISENNTGNEYFVDGSLTKRWFRSYMPVFDIGQGRNQTTITPFTNFYLTSLVAGLSAQKLNNLYDSLKEIFEKSQKEQVYKAISDLQVEGQKEISAITGNFAGDKYIDKVLAENKVLEQKEKIAKNFGSKIDEMAGPINIALQLAMTKFQGELQNWHNYYDSTISPFIRDGIWRTGYIGQNNSTNNGFFKDRFQRKVLDWQLYDENRNPVHDDTLSITDLQGQTVTNRPAAYWYYLLKSEGIGETTVSGIWRDSQRDQVVLWGFVKKDEASKIKYLTFEDQSGQKFNISVSTKNNDNLFYLKRQADPSTKWTLADEGYTSWITSWSIIGDFKNALLRPNESGSREFRVYFSDANNKEIPGLLDLGHYEFVAENGKNYNTAPTFLTKKGEQTYFVVRTQFS